MTGEDYVAEIAGKRPQVRKTLRLRNIIGCATFYRQAQIYARSGIELHRSTLADWVGKASFHLRPVYECLKAELKPSNHLGLDETTVRVLDPGRGKTKTGYMWTMARDERGWSGPDPPGCVYEYVPSRSGKHGEKLLEGFQGTVQVDGYPGHNRLRREDRPGGALTLAACWTYVAARIMLRRAAAGVQ
ncbi:MAG: transposase, partial [Chromatiales bacterium]|nr:transposase [Chromatiales bacterium]